MALVKVACVLRSGGDYQPEHVYRLQAAVGESLPAATFTCLSDVDLTCERVPLETDWPGWWAKMELFRPGLGDLLYFDLDTVIWGDLWPLVAAASREPGPVIMRDVYRPYGLQSSIMWIPEADKRPIWAAFTRDPKRWMDECRRGGDQLFLERFWANARRWQDICPRAIVSYKANCMRGVPAGAKVVVFHGRPRPWTVGWLRGAA